MAVDIAEAVSETVDKIKSNGDNAKAYNVDISDEQQVVDFVSDIKEQFGRIDVLFNNAGVDNAAGRIHEYPLDVYDKIMNVDMRGTFLMTKMILPLMMALLLIRLHFQDRKQICIAQDIMLRKVQ
ncbi:hypothetical protein Y000_09150 [Staphylococcus aureus MUF168]|nr:hypothetical protein Y000_09150 [Staphylococcus aureus MUF168]GBW94512.1 short chain dehydrogenase [Staphylococcus aureus]GBZ84986.1 short chain dehydrogenase [Staphylococcus aureus]